MMIHAARYTTNPTPVQSAIPSQRTRTRTTSIPKYRAKPAQTPATFLLRLSSINARGISGAGAAAVRLPQREQNRSSSRNSTPHFVQYIRSLHFHVRSPAGKCSAVVRRMKEASPTRYNATIAMDLPRAFVVSISIACQLLLTPFLLAQEETPDKRLQRSAETLREVATSRTGGIPVKLIEKARCIVIVPDMKKAAF